MFTSVTRLPDWYYIIYTMCGIKCQSAHKNHHLKKIQGLGAIHLICTFEGGNNRQLWQQQKQCMEVSSYSSAALKNWNSRVVKLSLQVSEQVRVTYYIKVQPD